MLIAKLFDKDNVFIEAIKIENASWTRQKNKEYTFDVSLAETPNDNDFVVRIIDTESILRVLPSGYISSTDGERKISIKSWENMLSDVGQIPENWSGWDGKNLQQIIPDLCYGFRKIVFASLSQLQQYVFSEHIDSEQIEDSNGDVYLSTFNYFNEHEIAYYDNGSVIYRIEIPSEARRSGMKLRWVDSVGDTTDISVQFRWSDSPLDWTGSFSNEISPTRSESITPNQTSGIDIPEGNLSYLFIRFNLKYDAGTNGENYEQQITTVQGPTENIVYYGCTPRLSAFEVIYRVSTMIEPGVISAPSKILTADIHERSTLLDSLKAISEEYDLAFFCTVSENGSILLNVNSSYTTDVVPQIGCISNAVNANVLSKDKDLNYYDACHCYGSGSGIDRIYSFVTLPGIVSPKNITTYENDEIGNIDDLASAGLEYIESENNADTVVKFGWYGELVLQIHDRAKIRVGDIIYNDNITEESFSFDANGLSKREYVIGIKTYPLRGVLGGSFISSQIPSVQPPSNVKAKRGNDGWIISWSSNCESFIVEYKRAAQTWWSRKTVNSHSITIPLVENNTSYTFRIYAILGSSISLPSSTIANSGVSDVGSIISGDPNVHPNNASSVSAVASEEHINISWSWAGTGIENTVERFAIDISKDNKTSWQRFYSTSNGYIYTFDRDIDGYPSTEELDTWFVRIKAINIYGVESSDYAPLTGQKVTYPNYLGWEPSVPSVSTRSSGRGVTILWGQSIPVYGERLYDVQIAKGYTIADNEVSLITDLETLDWFAPSVGLNPRLSYDNYKEGAEGGFASRSGNAISLALPLYGQNEASPFAADTPYYVRVRATSDVPTTELPNERNEGSWTSATLVYAYGSSAQDIVENAILNAHIVDDAVTANKISVALLSAISANIGVITDGAFVGNENNMWAVSTVYEEDGITPKYYSGTLKAGGSNQYLHITPRLSGGVPTGEYDIDFKVGNFTVTAIGSTINGIFEIRNVADNVVYFSVDPSKYGVAKIRNSLEIGGPSNSIDRLTIKEGYAITGLEFTGTGIDDMEIVEEGLSAANIEIVIRENTYITLYPTSSGNKSWNSITSDKDGNIWATARDEDIYKCDAGSTTFLPTSSGNKRWLGITSDKDGNIWAVVYGGDIYKCNAGSTIFLPTSSGNKSWDSITSDKDGNIWATAYGEDIYKCNAGSTIFLPTSSGNKSWNSITSDKDGNIWAVVFIGYIYKCDAGSTTFLPTSSGDGNINWYNITSDKYGNIWAVANGVNIYKCDAGSTTFLPTSSGVKTWYNITSDKYGNIWVVVRDGDIYKCDAGSTTFLLTSSGNKDWFDITSDKDGNIWATAYGEDIYKYENFENYFAWRETAGVLSENIGISVGTQYELSPYGTKIQFSHDTGHVIGDKWTFHQGLVGSISARDSAGVEFFSVKNGQAAVSIGGIMMQVGAGIIDSGYVSGRGWYIKFGDGTMIQTYWENIQRAFVTYTPVSPSGHMCASIGWVWTYPVPFVGNMPRSFICGDVSWGPGLESHLAYPTSTPLTTCNIEVVIGATANASLYVTSSYYTIGRWKA